MANLTTLVAGIRTALTTGSSPLFSTTNCFFALDPKKALSYPPSQQFAVIQPGRLKVKERTFGQGGVLPMLARFEVTVWVFVQFLVDAYNRSDSYLLDQTYGSVALADSVIDTLQQYSQQDGTTQWGYELAGVEWQTEERDNIGWAYTKLSYHTDLTGRT